MVPSSPDPERNIEAEAIIAEALEGVRAEINGRLKRSIDLTSISIPQHFNDSLYGTVGNSAQDLEKGIVRPWQVRRYYNAVRLAYHLNSCEGFGMDSSTCHIEEGPHLVLFVDYNGSYLEFYIADVGDFTFTEIGRMTLKGYGADKLVVEVCT